MEAKKKQDKGRKKAYASRRGEQVGCDPKTTTKSRDQAGELVGVGGTTIDRMTRVARERPDLDEKVKACERVLCTA